MKLVLAEILLTFATLASETNSAQQEGNIDSVDVRVRCWDRRGQFPHLIYCDWFYNCWDGAIYEQQCPQELAFNPSIQACDYPANVDCGPRTLSWDHVKDLRCPKRRGIFPDPSRGCSAFVLCDRGSAVEFACSETLHFNPATSVCDYSYNVWPVCQDDPSTDGFRCPLANGVFAHEDCDKFWTCVNNRPTMTTCVRPTLFDARYARCVDARYAQCYDVQLPVNLQELEPKSEVPESADMQGMTSRNATTAEAVRKSN